ncbi:MAG: GH3 auxin-responsive promoter family protein [Phycisphaerales bacterium]|nr:GH3 auxin-responsive promoter family protein [Phycisphaerales bacterium]
MISTATSCEVAPRRPIVDRLLLPLARGHADRTFKRFMRAVQSATRTQHKVLLEKVRRNASSAFGRDFGFGEIRTYADYAKRVPILRYETLAPYIDRVRRGEITAMFDPRTTVHMFAKTSGTTDKPKYIPVTTPFLDEYRRGWNAFGIKVIRDHPGCFLRSIVQVASPMDEEHTALGIPCGAVTGLMAATQKRLVRRYYVVPRAVAYIADADARYYTIVRFAATADPAFFITASPATQLRLARTMDASADRLIRDVREGTLSTDAAIAPELRRQLNPHLSPDPARAKHLERIAESTGRLLARDVWNLGFLANWTGGTMGLYLREFPDYFGNTPVRDIGLIASEGRMSIPIEDGTPAGVLNVADNFYEFIPANDYGSDKPPVLRSHELSAGEEYFILLTTSAGFYRYDIGDRVRVTGYMDEAPLIEFLHKGIHASSLTGEKLTEQQAVMAFAGLEDVPDSAHRHFVLAPQWGDPPHYRLHLEDTDLTGTETARLAEAYDRRLQEINVEYASKRSSGRLGAVEVNVVPNGWLAARDRGISERQRASNEQFKHCYLLSEVDADAEFPSASTSRT